jgi:DNA-binding response OmpR family regulator
MAVDLRHILLVEDQEVVRRSLERALRFGDFVVTAVATADDAQEALLAGPFDLLLSDIALAGGMDGLALATWARRHFATLPILLVSGLTHPQMPIRLRQDELIRSIVKPFGMGLLLGTISELLRVPASPPPALSKAADAASVGRVKPESSW